MSRDTVGTRHLGAALGEHQEEEEAEEEDIHPTDRQTLPLSSSSSSSSFSLPLLYPLLQTSQHRSPPLPSISPPRPVEHITRPPPVPDPATGCHCRPYNLVYIVHYLLCLRLPRCQPTVSVGPVRPTQPPSVVVQPIPPSGPAQVAPCFVATPSFGISPPPPLGLSPSHHQQSLLATRFLVSLHSPPSFIRYCRVFPSNPVLPSCLADATPRYASFCIF
ncbi:hypothetical protein F5B22DRAFT_427922 [Xylaria bambusicola]|uniref:uncharacterized protein n=1 Tax=Xylaria bambusicola TaxID=326684 RepID=UPI002007FAB7|nr:uncharacterized protein F5B22DRAFT_427922 [Xylaria bambusicola]KAI0506906.1 hypothetical protein F5B22DRAFT_427922 [Xylaria bambusicola]